MAWSWELMLWLDDSDYPFSHIITKQILNAIDWKRIDTNTETASDRQTKHTDETEHCRWNRLQRPTLRMVLSEESHLNFRIIKIKRIFEPRDIESEKESQHKKRATNLSVENVVNSISLLNQHNFVWMLCIWWTSAECARPTIAHSRLLAWDELVWCI